MQARWIKYVFVFLITCGIFAASWYLSEYFSRKKLAEIRTIQDRVATSIAASETDFALLQELSCESIDDSITSEELANLAERISFSEQNLGSQGEIAALKAQYSILEVKDFLLKKRVSERCGTPFTTVLYFYGTKNDCEDCVRQSYVLDALRQDYPTLGIYSFDYYLDLSTIRALKRIYEIGNELPALVVNGKTVAGFKTAEEIEGLLPKALVREKETREKAEAAAAAKAEKSDTAGQ